MMAEPHAPSAGESLRFEVNLQQRINTFVALETARRSICCYTADPCDCKYGGEHPAYPGTEATGCPELRDLIFVFWFCAATLNPIVLYELGTWSVSDKKIAIGVEPGYQREQDVRIQTSLVRPDVTVVSSLDDLAREIL
jgi:hypothetical protein